MRKSKKNKRYQSPYEVIPNTAEAELVKKFLEFFAEYEREERSQRIKRGLRRKRTQESSLVNDNKIKYE